MATQLNSRVAPRRGTLFGLAVAALTSLALAGCSPASTGEPGKSASASIIDALKTSTAAGSEQVDSIRWNLAREPISLDPMTAQTEAEGPVVGNLCEPLVRLSADLKIEPNLAESYQQESPTVWRFNLQPGVTFWNGKPLTSADVVASLTRSFSASTSYWTGYFSAVKNVSAIDDKTVQIELSRPDALFLKELTTAGGAISSAAALEAGGDKYGSQSTGVQCTGPFRFTAWNPGSSLTITRNDSYWKKGRLPKVRTVTFSWISDEATLTQSLANGEIDGTFAVPFSGVETLRKSGAGNLTLGMSSSQLMLIPTEKGGPLADPNVRNAVFKAIDRKAIATQLLHDAALPGQSFVAPYWSEGAEDFKRAYDALSGTQDLTAAKSLLGGKAVTLDVATPSGESYTRVANAMAQMLQQVGVTMNVKVLTSSENEALFFDESLRAKYDGFLSLPFTNVPDPLEQLLYVSPGNVYNYGKYENKEFTNAFGQAMAEQAPDKRVQLTLSAQEIAQKDLPWIPIAVEPVRLWQSSRISGAPASFSYLYGDWAAGIGGTSAK